MKVKPDKSSPCGKTKVAPGISSVPAKMTFDPEQISPGDMIVQKGRTRSCKLEYEWAQYIILQRIVTTSRLRDEPRTAFKALLLSCHESNASMLHMVGSICYITKGQLDIARSSLWWETVVESGLSWEEGKDRLNVNNGEGR